MFRRRNFIRPKEIWGTVTITKEDLDGPRVDLLKQAREEEVQTFLDFYNWMVKLREELDETP